MATSNHRYSSIGDCVYNRYTECPRNANTEWLEKTSTWWISKLDLCLRRSSQLWTCSYRWIKVWARASSSEEPSVFYYINVYRASVDGWAEVFAKAHWNAEQLRGCKVFKQSCSWVLGRMARIPQWLAATNISNWNGWLQGHLPCCGIGKVLQWNTRAGCFVKDQFKGAQREVHVARDLHHRSLTRSKSMGAIASLWLFVSRSWLWCFNVSGVPTAM